MSNDDINDLTGNVIDLQFKHILRCHCGCTSWKVGVDKPEVSYITELKCENCSEIIKIKAEYKSNG